MNEVADAIPADLALVDRPPQDERLALDVVDGHLQRQLRAFPISETIEVSESDNCDLEAPIFAEHARVTAVNQCFDRGGILASLPKTQIANLDGICRVTSSIQCENIP